MKKIVLAILVLGLFSGCGKGSKDQDNNTSIEDNSTIEVLGSDYICFREISDQIPKNCEFVEFTKIDCIDVMKLKCKDR